MNFYRGTSKIGRDSRLSDCFSGPAVLLTALSQRLVFKRILILFCAFLGTSAFLHANVKLPQVFGTHMVLQRDVAIPVWGTADPGEAVTVTIGTDSAAATAGTDGKWRVNLPARPASATPVNVVVTGKNTITFQDVLLGDVWVASGQSNMDWAFFWGNGVLNTQAEIAAANYPLIRDCKVKTTLSATPQDDFSANWAVCTPTTVSNFTATGYFFARNLFQQLNIPIGIVNSSYGGTEIEAWMSADSAATLPFVQENWQSLVNAYPGALQQYNSNLANWTSWQAAAQAAGQPFNIAAPVAPTSSATDVRMPSSLFNAMIHPFLPYAIKGTIWWQGENNVTRAAQYRSLFPAMIQGWRAAFGQGDFPFYWVQLANYSYESTPNATEWAFLREAQNLTLSQPNTGQAVTVDIGLATQIHMPNKQEVGRRLALLALNRTYGYTNLVDSGPAFDHADFTTNPARIYFTHVDGGLQQASTTTGQTGIVGFQVAGNDQVFYPAQAQIDSTTNTVLVSSTSVPTPVAVRYAWYNDPEGLSLVNGAALPTVPFRTDNWEEKDITSSVTVGGTQGVPFSYQITASNNPTSFGATGLLAGLSVDPTTGIISGTPASSGTSYATITASDATSTSTATLIFILQQPPAFTNGPPPAQADSHSRYNFVYTKTGYPVPTFSVSTGALPPGLTLSSTGTISGTPTALGSYSGTVFLTNGVGPDAVQSFSIAIQQAPSITNTPPLASLVGSPYTFTYTYTGYPAPSFSVTSGSLPPGLSLRKR